MAYELESANESPDNEGRAWEKAVRNEIRHVSAADAASLARANIRATRDAAPATDPEFALTRNTEHETRNTNSWPITRPNIPGAEPGESPLMTVFRQARTEIGGWGTRAERTGGEPNRSHIRSEFALPLLSGHRRSMDSLQGALAPGAMYGTGPSFDGDGKKPITGEPHGGAAESLECEELRRQAERTGSATDWADYYLRCKGIMYDPGLGGYGNLPPASPSIASPRIVRQPMAAPVCICKFPCFKPAWEPHWKGAPEGRSDEGCSLPLGRVVYAEFQLLQSSLKPEDVCVIRAFPSGRVKLVEGEVAESDVASAQGAQELPEKKMTCPSSRLITIIPVTQGPVHIVAAWGSLVCTLDLTIGPPEKCGCKISCAELAADGTVVPKMGNICSLLVDFSDPKTTAYSHVALALDLVGAKGAPANWSLYSRDFPPLVEFTTDASVGAGGSSAVPEEGAAYDVSFEDREAECGARIWILARPTDAAVSALQVKDPSGPITAHLVALVGKTKCPIEIEIGPYCDEQAHKEAIGKREHPEIRFAPLKTRHGSVRADGGVNSASPEVARIYSDLRPGFSGDDGYRVFIHADVDLSVESDWQPPDCCCLWLTDIVVRVNIDVISDGVDPSAAAQASMKSLVANELARVESSSQAELTRMLKARGIEETPHCLSDARSACDFAGQELEDYLADGLASYVTSHFHRSEYYLCRRAGPEDDVWIANARGLVRYREVPVGYDVWGKPDLFKGTKEYAEPNTAFGMKDFLRGVSGQSSSKPCCFLVWVHGYNTDESEGLDNVRMIQSLYNGLGGCCQLVGFLWHGDPSTRLNFGQAIVAANISAQALIALVSYLKQSFPGSSVSLAAHSLGSRVALQATKRLPKGTIDSLILFNAAVDYDALNVGKEFGDVPGKVHKVWVIFHRHDDALIASSLPFAPFGPYYWAQQNVALGARGPMYPGAFSGDVESIDMTVPWTYRKGPNETTHSALYVYRISSSFFGNRFPFMIAGDQVYCARK